MFLFILSIAYLILIALNARYHENKDTARRIVQMDEMDSAIWQWRRYGFIHFKALRIAHQ